jgi:fibronectin type 3 domain-containing protein
MIAPLWDDLAVDGAAKVYYQTTGTVPNRVFIVQWSGVRFLGDRDSSLTFEVLLYERGGIVFQYQSLNSPNFFYVNGSSATVGIENSYGNAGLQYSFNRPVIEPGLAISFFPALTVLSTSPSDGAEGVGLNSNIFVTFDQSLDVSTITEASVLVNGSISNSISGETTYMPSANSLEFSPAAEFSPGETITVTVGTEVGSVTGSSLQSGYVWTFTAGGAADNESPSPVTSLVANDVPNDAGGKIQLAWAPSPADDLAYYRVYRDTAPITAVAGLAPLASTIYPAYLDAGTTDGAEYYYAVTAVDISGNEDPSVQAVGPVSSVDDPPLTPTGLNGGMSSNGIGIYWNGNSEEDIEGYRIYFGAESGNYTGSVDAGYVTSYELTGLESCTQYYIAVTAYDSAGNESAYSSEVFLKSGAPGSPSAPTGLTATSEESMITLSWNPNPECDIQYYYVYRADGSISLPPVPPEPYPGYCEELRIMCRDIGDPFACLEYESFCLGNQYNFVYLATVQANETSYIDRNITGGTEYRYKITASDGSGSISPYSAEASAVGVDTTPPPRPTSLSAYLAYDGIRLSWFGNSAYDRKGYKIYYGTASGEYTQTAAYLTSYGGWNYYTLSGLQGCTDYFMAVSSYDLSGNESALSNEVSINSGSAGSPPAPTGLVAASEESIITLTWDPNPECDVNAYYIYRSTTSGGGYQYLATVYGGSTTTYVDEGIVDGVTYYYKIVARDSFNHTSPYSAEASAVAIDTTPPPQPTSLSAYLAYDGIGLRWYGNYSAYDREGYKIYYGTASGEYAQTAAYPTSYGGWNYYTLSGLQGCTDYFMAVSSYDPSGNESALSNEVSANSGSAGSPSAPTGLTAVSEESIITLTWDPNPECDVNAYYIYRSTTSGGGYQHLATVYGGSTTTYVDERIADGVTYYYKIIARDSLNYTSPYSAEASAVGVDTTPPPQPTRLSAYLAYDGIGLRWYGNYSAYDREGYRIYYGTASGEYAQTAAYPSSYGGWNYYTLSGLQDCTDYFIAVSSYDLSENESALSNEVSANSGSAGSPSAPTGLAAVSEESIITLTWNPNPECDVSGYYIYRSTTSGGGYQHLATIYGGSTTTYVDERIADGVTYYYKIIARDSLNYTSPYSAEVSATGIDTTPPEPPTAVYVYSSAGANYLYVNWNNNSEKDIAGYKVYYGTSSGDYSQNMTVGYSYAYIYNLQGCTPYYIVVTAYDLSGHESGYSEEKVATVLSSSLLQAPSGMTIASEESAITLGWDANTECDIYRYKVYRSTTSGSGYQEIATVYGTSYTDRRIADGARYYYRVKAMAYSGTLSPYSPEISAVAIDTTPPGRPSYVYANAGDNFIDVSWWAGSSYDVKEYRVHYGTQTGSYETYVTATSTSVRLSGLQSCTAYYISVQAVDFSGLLSPYSTEASAVSSLPGAPAAPEGLSGEGADNAAMLTWSQNPECDIKEYRVYRSQTSGSNHVYVGKTAGTTYQDGNLLSETAYYYLVRAVDNSGSIGEASAEIEVVTSDTTPPIQPVLDPSLSLFSATPAFTLRGTKEENSSILINGEIVVSLDASATWEVQVTLAQTENDFAITSMDQAGNECEPVNVMVAWDTEPPFISSPSPEDGYVTNVSLETVEITLADTHSGVDIDASLSGATITDASGINVAGSWSASGPEQITFTADTPMGEGVYTITLHPIDNMGNSGTGSVVVAIDQSPPPPPGILAYPSLTNSDPQQISGSRSEDTATVILGLNGGAAGSADSYPTGTSWQGSLSGFVEGVNTVTAVARDEAGNTSAPVSVEIVYDITPPSVPTVDSFVSPTNEPVITLSGSKVADSYLYIDGSLTSAAFSGVSWSQALTLKEGSNSIEIYCMDEAGNRGQSRFADIALDTTPPRISSTVPAESSYTRLTDGVEIVLVDDYSSIDYESSLAGAFATTSAGFQVDGSWSVQGNQIVFTPYASLEEGTYVVTLSPTDNFGNSGISSFSFTVDLSFPQVSSLAMSPSSPHKAENVTFTLTFDENMDTGVQPSVSFSRLFTEYSLTGGWVNQRNWRGTYGFTADTGDGTYKVAAAGAKDQAGNAMESSEVGTFVLDTEAPGGPTINDVQSPSNVPNQLLSGAKPSDTAIVINGIQRVPLDGATTWSYSYPLSEGRNVLSARARDAAGNDSTAASAEVVLDTTPPLFTIGAYAKITNTSSQTLAGAKDPGSIVKINGAQIYGPDDTGSTWSHTVDLVEGIPNKFTFTASDALGNTRTQSIEILFDVSAPAPLGQGVLVADGSGSGTELTLSWDAYVEAQDVGYYRVYVSPGDFAGVDGMSPTGTVDKGIKTYKLSGLTEGSTYYFAVVPVDMGGNYDPAVHTASGAPEDTAAPEDVKIVGVTAGHNETDGNWITVKWNPSADTAGDLSDQVLYFDDGSGYDVGTSLGKAVTEYTGTGLADGSVYKFKVTTKDANGYESAGAMAIGVTRLANPANLVAAPGNKKVSLSWTAVDSEYLKAYRVYRLVSDVAQTDAGAMVLVDSVTGTSYVDTGLVNDWTYQYAITAINVFGAERTSVESVAALTRMDETGPQITGFNINEGDVITAPVEIAAQASDAESDMGRMELYVDGVQAVNVLGSILGYFWNVIPVQDGNYTLSLAAYDKFGNYTEITRNVIVSLAPPATPQITGHAVSQTSPVYLVSIEGTTSLDATVELRVNGVVVTSASGVEGLFSFDSVELREGDNLLAVKATHRGGESPYSPEYRIVVDTGAPPAPVNLSAQTLSGGMVSLSWQAGTGENPVGYNLYMGTVEFAGTGDAGVTKVNTTPLKYTYKEYLPPDDVRKYYAVTALDSSGNESDISNMVSAVSDRVPPTLQAIAYTYIAPDGAMYDSASVVGVGIVNVSITASEPLKEMPFLSFEPDSGSPIIVNLSKTDDTHYTGGFEVSAQSPDGVLTYKFSGKDMAGNRGSRQGEGMTLDVSGPVAGMQSPLQIQQIVETPVEVQVLFNEPSVETPELKLMAPDGTVAVINGLTSPDNLTWSGAMDISGMPEGEADFVLVRAKDTLGNLGTRVGSGRTLLLYKDSVPPPAVPAGLEAKSEKGGGVSISWNPMAVVTSFNLWRRAEGEAGPIKVQEGLLDSSTADIPSVDGIYYYSVSAVGLLESESGRSVEIMAVSDRQGPAAPSNLALVLDGTGVAATWDASPDETVYGYHMYRLDSPEASTDGLAPVAKVANTRAVDTAPRKASRYYAVVAVDSLKNEGPLSEIVGIDFPVLPVRSLVLERIDSGAPTLTWQPPSGAMEGYHIYRNGMRITPSAVSVTTYTDGYYAGGTMTYAVSVVDTLGNESPKRELVLSPVTAAVQEGTVLRRGLLENVRLDITSGYAEAIEIDTIRVKVGTSPESALSGAFAVGPGETIQVEKVAATSSSAQGTVAVVVSLAWEQAPGTTVKLTQTSRADVIGSSTALEIFNEPLVRNAARDVQLKFNNLGSALMEVLTSENNGETRKVKINLKDQDGNLLSTGYLNQRTGNVVNLGSTAVARIEPGGSFITGPVSLNVPDSSPNRVVIEAIIENTYYHYGKADQVTAPGMRMAVETTIVEAPYRATAAPEHEFYATSQPVLITGQALDTSTGEPVPNVPVKLGVSVKGFDRFYDVTTDGAGSFSHTFEPGANEAGLYSVWAVHPDVFDRTVQATFAIAGFKITPPSARITMGRGRSLDVPATLSNYGGAALTGLAFSTESSDGITAEVINPGDGTLVPGENAGVTFRVSAAETAPETGYANMGATVEEGLEVNLNSTITTVNLVPAIWVSPQYIDTGMLSGDQKIVSFVLKNKGLETLENARLEGPSTTWMTLATDRVIGDLTPGQGREIGIVLRPPEGLESGVYDDKIVIYSDNHTTLAYHVQVTVSSSSVGNVMFDVLNEFMEDVPGASIVMQHQTVYDLKYEVTTGADGTAMVYDIPSGRYIFNISASGHQPYSGSFNIEPGMTTTVPIGLELTLVDIEWSVTPVIIEDRYEITVTQTFETKVPAPVLIVEPPSITLPDLEPGEVFNGEIQVTNYGLIKMFDVRLDFPTVVADYEIEFLEGALPTELKAMQSVTVPYRITKRSPADASGTASLFDEVKGYGGWSSCLKYFYIWVRGKAVICPNSPQERTVDKYSGTAMSYYYDCFFGGGGGGGGAAYYGGGGGGSSNIGSPPQSTAIETKCGSCGACCNILIKRKHIHLTGDDKYGHWWVEIGNESYGWWPKKPVGLLDTLIGVEGELNGQTYFGGTSTTDPHHGDSGEEEFYPHLSSSAPDGYSCEKAAECIRDFANSYSGSWSWPCGQNCHSFQEAMMSQCNLK